MAAEASAASAASLASLWAARGTDSASDNWGKIKSNKTFCCYCCCVVSTRQTWLSVDCGGLIKIPKR